MLTLLRSTISSARRRAPSEENFGAAHSLAYHYERVLGTLFELQLRASDETVARHAHDIALAEVDRLEAILSGWHAQSELACWMGTFGTPRNVSHETAELLSAAESWRKLTSGAFNPVAQLGIPAGEDALWDVDTAKNTATRRTRLPASLDAIAKGYIVERAARAAARVHGVYSVMLNIGGDLQHFGRLPARVGITNPFAAAENAAPLTCVNIQNEALTTSGGYRRHLSVGNQLVSHIIDPRTGLPISHIASASVFAHSCASADALSTAFSVLSPTESTAIADSLPGVGCLIVEASGHVTANSAWLERAALPAPPEKN